ncbi:hypothetical protein L9F63_025363, partial [Diploptera punctata]
FLLSGVFNFSLVINRLQRLNLFIGANVILNFLKFVILQVHSLLIMASTDEILSLKMYE